MQANEPVEKTGRSRAIRLVARAVLAAGIAAVAISVVSGEPVNRSGFVPGAIRGVLLVVLGGMTWAAANLVRDRRHRSLVFLATLALWCTLGTYLLISMPGRGLLHDVPFGQAIAVAVAGFAGAGFLLTLLVLIGFVVPIAGMLLLAWVLDRVPALRERGWGAGIRAARPRF